MVASFFRPAAAAATFAMAACASPAANDPPETAGAYRALAASLEEGGMMRTATAPADAPFTNRDLMENFVEVALRSELDGGAAAVPLARWERPIRYRIGGRTASEADARDVAALMERLARLTDRSIEPAAAEANYSILFLNADERAEFVAAARRRAPEAAAVYESWAGSFETPCAFYFREGEGRAGVVSAVVLIKAETEGLLRESCIHEEVVQALGLANDADHIRPSLFNDDEEFALMTSHDEYLLRILYDRRLAAGMTEAEVRARLPEIVEELRPEAR